MYAIGQKRVKAWLAYVNMVGGQDELVFDGQSMIVDGNGTVTARAPAFEEGLLLFDIDVNKKPALEADSSGTARNAVVLTRQPTLIIASRNTLSSSDIKKTVDGTGFAPVGSWLTSQNWHYAPPTANPLYQNSNAAQLLPLEEEIYRALVLGLRDYVRKNDFQKVVIGLSGGIDSSLVATIAADALGRENVIGVAMPSRFSSKASLEDAWKLAKNLGIKFLVIPIEKPFSVYLQTLKSQFRGKKPDVTEENLQARIRGNILMALSNKFGWLVLATGNKSDE